MRRSRGFASTPYDLRPIQTRFRFGCAPEVLNLAVKGNSPAHYAKGTQSGIVTPKSNHSPPTAL